GRAIRNTAPWRSRIASHIRSSASPRCRSSHGERPKHASASAQVLYDVHRPFVRRCSTSPATAAFQRGRLFLPHRRLSFWRSLASSRALRSPLASDAGPLPQLADNAAKAKSRARLWPMHAGAPCPLFRAASLPRSLAPVSLSATSPEGHADMIIDRETFTEL